MTSPRSARRFTGSFLADQDRDDLATDATLLVAELVTNAVLHGTAPIRLTVVIDGVLRIEVFDGDSRIGNVQARPPGSASEGGRGLHIVAAISDQWGTLIRPDAKTVWAELGRPASR